MMVVDMLRQCGPRIGMYLSPHRPMLIDTVSSAKWRSDSAIAVAPRQPDLAGRRKFGGRPICHRAAMSLWTLRGNCREGWFMSGLEG